MKKWVLLLLVVTVLQPAFGSSLEDLVGAERAAVLRSGNGPITDLQQKIPTPHLLPRHDELGRFVAEVKSSLDPNILVEALSLYRKPSATEWSKAEQTSLLNQMVALSTLAGIEYYSASRKTMRIFYETSSVIDNPVNKKPLPDPVYTTLPPSLEGAASLTLYARQKDLTFGDNIYQYDYRTRTDAIFFVQENVTSMNAGIIPAIGKNKFRTLVAVIDAGDCLLLYAAAMAKTVSLPGMGDRIGASFTNRMEAVFQWFVGRADGVFKK